MVNTKGFRFVRLAVVTISAALIFVMTLYSLFIIGPWIETNFNPVVGKLQIDSIEAGEEPGTSILHVRFNKVRDCQYLGLAWYRGTKVTSFERVPVVLVRKPGDTSSPNRPVGIQRAGPWIVSLSPEELRQNSFAELFHRCHPFWTTKTEFYP